MADSQPAASRPAARIVAKFGGIRVMARKGGWPVSTVQSWVAAGHIPSRRQEAILDLARRLQVDVQPADFFDASEAA